MFLDCTEFASKAKAAGKLKIFLCSDRRPELNSVQWWSEVKIFGGKRLCRTNYLLSLDAIYVQQGEYSCVRLMTGSSECSRL